MDRVNELRQEEGYYVNPHQAENLNIKVTTVVSWISIGLVAIIGWFFSGFAEEQATQNTDIAKVQDETRELETESKLQDQRLVQVEETIDKLEKTGRRSETMLIRLSERFNVPVEEDSSD